MFTSISKVPIYHFEVNFYFADFAPIMNVARNFREVNLKNGKLNWYDFFFGLKAMQSCKNLQLEGIIRR